MASFKLILKGDGITVERDVDHATALVILNSVLGSDLGPKSADEPPETAEPKLLQAPVRQPPDRQDLITEKPKSLREFVNEYEPKTNAQVVLCIAQFLAHQEGVGRFRRDEIKRKFAAAGVRFPKNYTRDFQTAIDKGWIGEDPSERDTYFVTNTGERQLDVGFKGRRN
jgi:hypothetical protein